MSLAAPPRPKPPPPADLRHRRVTEPLIIDLLTYEAWPLELDAGHLDAANRGAAAMLETAVGMGLGYARDTDGRRLFDPAEVDGFMEWSPAEGVESLWAERRAISNIGILAEARAAREAHAATATSGARFRIALRRTFDLSRLARGSRARLRMALPLHGVCHEAFSVTPVAPSAFEVVVSEGRLEARLAVPADPIVTIGADLDLVALPPAGRGEADRLTAREAELYLRPAEGLIRVTPRIRDLADQIAGSLPPEAAVAAFVAFMRSRFFRCFLRYDELALDAPGDWVLDPRLL